jgi:biopolymer transport protein ExbD
MSGGGPAPEPSGGGKTNVFGEEAPAAVELNLTALMDILSNLLFFLLASFGATIVMAINGTVPVQSADKSDVADTKQTVTVNIKMTKDTLELAPMGMSQTEEELGPMRKTIGRKGDSFDFDALTKHLQAIKSKWPRSDTIILTPEAGVNYDAMIRTMDASREVDMVVDGKSKPVKLFPTVVVSTVLK